MKSKIIYGPMPNLRASDKEIFSKPNKECVALYQDRYGRPVVVYNVANTPLPYRVEVGNSLVVFPRLIDARNYCERRFREVK